METMDTSLLRSRTTRSLQKYRIPAVVFFCAMVSAQVVYWLLGLYPAIWAYLVLAVVTIVAGFGARQDRIGAWLGALAILPIARLASFVLASRVSGFGWSFIEPDFFLFAVAAVYLWSNKFGVSFPQFRVPSLFHLSALVLSVGLGLLMASLLPPDNLPKGWATVVTLFSMGLLEEWIFRGILLDRSVLAVGRWFSVIFISFLYMAFAYLPMNTGASVVQYAAIFGVNVLLGYARLRGASSGFLGLCHGVINLAAFLV